MKGIDGILARAGRSETRTGKEVELDFDSITSGIGVEITMPNSTSGAKFLSFKSGTGDTEVFYVDKDGNAYFAGSQEFVGGVDIDGNTGVTGTLKVTGNADFGGTLTSVGRVTTSTEFTGTLDEDNTIGGSDLRAGQYVTDRARRYCEYFEDFLRIGPTTATGGTISYLFTRETGATTQFQVTADKPLGLAKLTAVSNVAADAASVQYRNDFVSVTNNKKYWFETRVKCQKLYKGEFFVGLANSDTSLAGAASFGTPSCTDFIGFLCPANSLKWHFIMSSIAVADKRSATSTSAVTSGTTGSFVRLGFSINTTGTGTTLAVPYVDGVAGSAPTQNTSKSGTSVPGNTAMTITSAVSTIATGVAALVIDYFNVVAER